MAAFSRDYFNPELRHHQMFSILFIYCLSYLCYAAKVYHFLLICKQNVRFLIKMKEKSLFCLPFVIIFCLFYDRNTIFILQNYDMTTLSAFIGLMTDVGFMS